MSRETLGLSFSLSLFFSFASHFFFLHPPISAFYCHSTLYSIFSPLIVAQTSTNDFGHNEGRDFDTNLKTLP